jgi:hypothetical protein
MRKPVRTRVRELFVHARQHEMARIGLFRIQFVEALAEAERLLPVAAFGNDRLGSVVSVVTSAD